MNQDSEVNMTELTPEENKMLEVMRKYQDRIDQDPEYWARFNEEVEAERKQRFLESGDPNITSADDVWKVIHEISMNRQ